MAHTAALVLRPSRRTVLLAALPPTVGVAAGLAGVAAPALGIEDMRLPTGATYGGAVGPTTRAAEEMKMENQPRLQGGDLAGKGGKRRKKFPDFQLTPSGLQVKDVTPGRAGTPEPTDGDTVVLSWEGYTINYFGRPFETRTLQDMQKIVVEPLRFKVGDGTVIPAIDEAVRGMREGGVRQLIVPVELGYDEEKKLLPRPSTFSGQRALDFVLDNKGGLMDKTLLINVDLKKVYQKQ